MEDKVLQLKKLNAAYIAALEWDYCPEPEKIKEVMKRFKTGISKEQLGDALLENQGSRPDEIAGQMSELIKTL
jgi:hypothetical protein